MIDFRYHVVSLTAVFLALGLGVLAGTLVINAATVNALEVQIRGLKSNLREARTDIESLRRERDQGHALVDHLTPFVVPGRLRDRSVVVVYDGAGGRWRETVRDALTQAGARTSGTLTLTDRWKLDVAGTGDELARVVGSSLGPFEPGARPAESALTLLGSHLFDTGGHNLLRGLADAGFVSVAGADLSTEWPPRGALVVAFASAVPKTAPNSGWLAALARGVARESPTLVCTSAPADFSAVTVLRETSGLPESLSTYDSGNASFARIGAVVALEAAIRGKGGHFGAERGRRLVPEPG